LTADYHINHEDEFVTLRFDGDTDLVDAYELTQQLLTDPDFRADWPQLVDLRGININVQPGAMRPFARYTASAYRPRVTAPIAVVLDGSMDDAFCAGVFRLVCSLPQAEVFDDYALAIKWLLKNSVVPVDGSAQPQDADGDQPDEEPEQIRA
jgi:hypothetical protein